MAFEVPPDFASFPRKVEARFFDLLKCHIFSGITEERLKGWLSNFKTDQERYLSAHLLDALVYRDDDMLVSMCRQVMEMELPNALRATGFEQLGELDDFLGRVAKGDLSLPFRVVAVDGTFTATPAKSGGRILHHYAAHARLDKRLTIRPENLSSIPDHVKWLVFLDDFAGTGTQFETYLEHYALQTPNDRFRLIYVPLIMHSKAKERFARRLPHVYATASEILAPQHRFFQTLSGSQGIWARDHTNRSRDAITFYNDLLKSRGIHYQNTTYNLGITVGFNLSTPNNSLKIYWTDEAGWRPLLIRT